MTSFSPKHEPGYKSAPEPLDSNALARLVAGSVETCFGVIGFFVSVMMLPNSIFTVILSGVSIVMVSKGAYNAWTAARYENRLRLWARIFVWGGPIALFIILILLAVLGPSAWPLAGFA